MIHLIIGILVVALVWVLTAALGLPYIVSVIITILAALYVLGPGLGVFGGGRSLALLAMLELIVTPRAGREWTHWSRRRRPPRPLRLPASGAWCREWSMTPRSSRCRRQARAKRTGGSSPKRS